MELVQKELESLDHSELTGYRVERERENKMNNNEMLKQEANKIT